MSAPIPSSLGSKQRRASASYSTTPWSLSLRRLLRTEPWSVSSWSSSTTSALRSRNWSSTFSKLTSQCTSRSALTESSRLRVQDFLSRSQSSGASSKFSTSKLKILTFSFKEKSKRLQSWQKTLMSAQTWSLSYLSRSQRDSTKLLF